MKAIIFFCNLLLSLSAMAQQASLTVQVSSDSVWMGNTFEVKFVVENADIKNFSAPEFAGMHIVAGPNVSTSKSIINGQVSSRSSYSFILIAHEVGTFYIDPASAEIDGDMVETQPIAIEVLPNPEGIEQNTRLDEFFLEDLIKGGDDFLLRDLPEGLQPKKEETPKKKKYKTYKI